MEAQIIGLPGPSHYYGGLAQGNQASLLHAGQMSTPKAAALQCLDYMDFLLQKQVPTLWLPPHPRPMDDCYSSSFMWVANAGTFIASKSTQEHQAFFKPANLMSHRHRSLESQTTLYLFERLFKKTSVQILAMDSYPDEGAANHMQLIGAESIDLFVYNQKGWGRQSIRSMQKLIVDAKIKNPILLEQKRAAVGAGVFHNDVIAMSCGAFAIWHQDAFTDSTPLIQKCEEIGVQYYIVPRSKLSLEKSITSYFFNSNWYESHDGRHLILAQEANQPDIVNILLELQKRAFIGEFTFLDLTQSMQNGGGPACLRLRLPMSKQIWNALHPAFKIDATKIKELQDWVETFPEQLDSKNLLGWKDQMMQIWQRMPSFDEIWKGYID